MHLIPLAAVGVHILLTSFDPFGGSARNNSQAIVSELARNAAALGSGVTIDTCNLPVVYDQAAQVAEDCVNRFHPDVVVSFGEADCELRIETAATNLDDTPGFPDNAGNERSGTEILPGGPNRVGFEFPVDAMYCGLETSSMPVEVSTSPGAFVCNNVAYHLGHDLSAKAIPFTFIHVPNSLCSESQMDPQANAATVARMLSAAIASLRGSSSAVPPMPKTQSEATRYLGDLESQHAPACQVRFAQQVLAGYQD